MKGLICMTMTQTLTIVGILTIIPLVSIVAYFLAKQKEDWRVKIPVRIDENEQKRY